MTRSSRATPRKSCTIHSVGARGRRPLRLPPRHSASRPKEHPSMIRYRGTYYLKLERANEHFEEIGTLATAFLKLKTQRLAIEHDPDTADEYIARIFIEAYPPPRLSLVVGDCLYNFRSALDHLAWEAVERNGE